MSLNYSNNPQPGGVRCFYFISRLHWCRKERGHISHTGLSVIIKMEVSYYWNHKKSETEL